MKPRAEVGGRSLIRYLATGMQLPAPRRRNDVRMITVGIFIGCCLRVGALVDPVCRAQRFDLRLELDDLAFARQAAECTTACIEAPPAQRGSPGRSPANKNQLTITKRRRFPSRRATNRKVMTCEHLALIANNNAAANKVDVRRGDIGFKNDFKMIVSIKLNISHIKR